MTEVGAVPRTSTDRPAAFQDETPATILGGMSRLIYTLVVFGALLAASVRDWIVGVVRARSLRPRAI